MQSILINFPNNEEDRVPTGHFSPSLFHLTEVGITVTWKSPNNPGCCQDNKLLSTNCQQDPTDDNTHITHWRWRIRAGVHKEPLPLCSSVFGMGRYSPGYQEKHKKPIQPKFLQSSYLKYLLGTKLMGVTNQYVIWLKAYFMSWNPYLTLLRWPRTRD